MVELHGPFILIGSGTHGLVSAPVLELRDRDTCMGRIVYSAWTFVRGRVIGYEGR